MKRIAIEPESLVYKFEILPEDVILEIYNHVLLITDKRIFRRTTKKYNKLTEKLFIEYENNYSIPGFEEIIENSLKKFTLELCHDGYYNLIPMRDLDNEIFVKAYTYFHKIRLLELCKSEGYNYDDTGRFTYFKIMEFMANDPKWWTEIKWKEKKYYHLDVLQWAHNNGCDFNPH